LEIKLESFISGGISTVQPQPLSTKNNYQPKLLIPNPGAGIIPNRKKEIKAQPI
jgi:hypothetical protein